MKISMMVLVLFTLTAQLLMAENKKEESYNYKRGVELLLEDDDMERGLSFLNKEIADHKDNGYAHLWISKVYFRQEKYGPALDAVYKACLFSLIDNPQQVLQYLSFILRAMEATPFMSAETQIWNQCVGCLNLKL